MIINAGARVSSGNTTLKKNNVIVGISASMPANSRTQIGISLNCNANDIINCTFSDAYDYQDEIMFGVLVFITQF